MASMTFAGCDGEEDEDEQSLQDWINEGLFYLSQGESAGAWEAFSQALKIDGSSYDALHGQTLADVMMFSETIDAIAALLGSDDDSEETDASSPSPNANVCKEACNKFEACGFMNGVNWSVIECSENCPNLYTVDNLECAADYGDCDTLADYCFDHFGPGIQLLLDDFLGPVTNEMFNNIESLDGQSDWALEVPGFTFSYLGLFEPDLSGENDLAEVRFTSSIANAIDGVLTTLIALNLDFNMAMIDNAELDLSALDEIDSTTGGDIKVLLIQVQNLIDLILGDPVYSDFLKLKDDDCQALVNDAADNLGFFFGDLVEMIRAIEDESDQQDNDAIRYDDKNRNEKWEDDEPMIFDGVGTLDRQLVLALLDVMLALKINFVDGVPFAINNLNGLLEYYDLDWATLILDALYLLDMGEIDLAEGLRNPPPTGLRGVLMDLYEILDVIINEL